MNVLLLTQYLALGGLERMVVSLACQLSQMGYCCHVVAYERNGLHAAFVDELFRSGVHFTCLQKRARFCFRTLFTLRRLICREKIEVLHTHDLGALIYGAGLAILCLGRVRIVHTQHSFVHFRKGLRRYRLYEKFFTRFVRKLSTVSRGVAHQYHSLGIPLEKIKTIPNGVEFPSSFIEVNHARKALLEKISNRPLPSSTLDVDQHWLISLGRVVAGKGHERIIGLWNKRSPEHRVGWKLIIVGPLDTDYAETVLCPLIASSEGATHDIVFAGPSENPSEWYFSADAFVSLSEQEGMPLTVIEASGIGLPLLLSNIEGHTGLPIDATFFPHAEENTDQSRFDQFLESAKRSRSGRFNRWIKQSSFRRRFGAQAMARCYAELYNERPARSKRNNLIRTFVSLLPVFFINSTLIAQPQQQLTVVGEKPEYLSEEDFAETVSFTLSKGESRILSLKNSDFCGILPTVKNSQDTARLTFKWYLGKTISTVKPSYEGAEVRPYVDPLIPISDRLECDSSSHSSAEWLFLEVSAAKNATPGIYHHRLISQMHPRQSSGEDQNTGSSWPMTIRILPLTFDGPWNLPLAAEFTPFFASLAHFGHATDQEGTLTHKYITSMVEHRVLPLKAWIRHPFKNPQERSNENFFLSRDPQPQLSFANTVLSALPEWAPVDIPRIDSADPSERLDYWRRWQSFLERTSEDDQESALQRRMAIDPFVYLWDEPSQEDFRTLREMSDSLKLGAPSLAALVTIYPWSGLLDSVQIFAPLLQTLEREGPPHLSQEHQLWAYVSCMSHGCGSERSSGEPDFVIERNASYIRVWPWMAHYYHLKRVLYYSVNNGWRKSPAVNPWESLWDFSGNGDGTLFYPGRRGEHGFSTDTPVPSLRLKLWRQASYDADYIALAQEKNPGCFAALVDEFNIVEDAFRWSRESRRYDQARDALIRCIESAPEMQSLWHPDTP